jgi:hypothetical protein
VLTVIASSPDRTSWASDCLQSLGRDAIIVTYGDYELGKIGWVMEHTKADRFLFLQDSWQIKSDGFWGLLNQFEGSIALTRDPYFFGCFTGVYERHVIEQVGVPVVTDKAHSILLEIDWNRRYVDIAGEPTVLFPELTDANATRVVQRHGRDNLVLENEFVVKWKGTWGH